VTSIGNSAFENATRLSRITFSGNAPASIGTNVFRSIASGAVAFVGSSATGFTTSGNPPRWNGLAVEVEAAPAPVVAPAPATSVTTPTQVVDTGLAARTVTAKKRYSARALAQQVGITIVSSKATVSIAAAKSSRKICTKSGSKLRTLKAGNCNVTFTVQEPKPKKGKKPKATKTTTTLIVQ
jgi:hypothetical protein